MYFNCGLVLCLWLAAVFGEKACYWNAECPYQMYSSKTPYDTVRGDIRDYQTPEGCEAVSVWHLQRHGNRNPGDSVAEQMKHVSTLRDDIVGSYDAGRSQLCAQDVEEFRKFSWNSTIEASPSYLTGVGYEELFDIASRIRQKFPQLLNGAGTDYYFCPTDEQRTITSGIAFIHGLSEGTNLTNLILSPYEEKYNVIRPYKKCQRYEEEVNNGQAVTEELKAYDTSAEYVAIRGKMQKRLGLNSILKNEDVYSFYEMCRFFRSWSVVKQSPWCSVFSDEDLVVLEYRDDVRHYWKNGYGSWVNPRLGGPALKDLFENFETAIQGGGRKLTAYFSHDTMMEMVLSALGLFNDNAPLHGNSRNDSKQWKTSSISAFSTNLMAILYKCTESDTATYRVQFLFNEKEVDLCRAPGCTWEEFKAKMLPFTETDLNFCDLTYVIDNPENSTDDGRVISSFLPLLVVVQICLFLR